MRLVIFSSIILLFISCSKPNKKLIPYRAGVVISFDDAYIDEWFEADNALKEYGWKATFCISKIDSIGKPQIQKLLDLQNKGHEIAGHGYQHHNAVTFVQKKGMSDYMKQEIDPMMDSMKKLSFHSKSFAYPYGMRSNELDKALSKKFSIIRGRDFSNQTKKKAGCYFRGSKFMYAFDIDDNHVYFSQKRLLELLDFAKKNGKIVILCCHKPVNQITANYQVKMQTLEFVCNYVKKNNLKFYTLSDLVKLY